MHYVKNIGYCEGQKVCSKREMAIRLARVHGYNGDSASFTRLVIESRVSIQVMNEAFRNGAEKRDKAAA